MAFKTITIKEDVYNELAGVKSNDESFSELLHRLSKNTKPSLRRFYGAWKCTKTEQKRIEKTITHERIRKDRLPGYPATLR